MVQRISKNHLHGRPLPSFRRPYVLYPVSPNLAPDDDSPLPRDGSFSFHFIIYRPANTNSSTPKKTKGHAPNSISERLEFRVKAKQRCVYHVTTPTLMRAFGLVFSPVFSSSCALLSPASRSRCHHYPTATGRSHRNPVLLPL